MKKRIYNIVLLAVLLLTAACNPEEKMELRFNATLEQPKSGDDKVHLVDEQWIYWDENDIISIAGDKDNKADVGILVNYNSFDYSNFNGVFLTNLAYGSKYFVGLYPHNEDNVIKGTSGNSTFADVKIVFPAVQSYANDSTFGQQVLPMVAWYGGEWVEGSSAPYNLDFHSLAGIVRLQVFNAGSENKTIKEIRISSKDVQLSGLFAVNGYKSYVPWVTDTKISSTFEAEDTTIVIRPDSPLDFSVNKLLSFYVPLPVKAGGSETATTTYNITVTVVSGDDQKSSIRSRGLPIRRNSILYTKSLGIGTTWTSKPSVSVTGCGTITRPFKIYDTIDLCAVRDAYNSTERRLNGQPLTKDTYFRIMRSDIVLNNTNWTENIHKFVGHMEYYATTAALPGIVNVSNLPIFDEIGDGTSEGIGVVRGLTVRTSVTSMTIETAYSPLCRKNNSGSSIIDCHLTSSLTAGSEGNINTAGSDMAGICVENHGLLQGCGVTAHFQTSHYNVAGICLLNHGRIKACYAASTMSISGAETSAGICFNNGMEGVVEDCYFAARIVDASTPWSGIVFNNYGTVSRCYASETGTILSTSTVAGIVSNNNSNGTVDRCWSSMAIHGSSVGLIVLSQATNTAAVTNSFVNAPLVNFTVTNSSGYGGGIVGNMLGGAVRNCFVYTTKIDGSSSDIGGIVGKHEGGTVKTCYSYEWGSVSPHFYGTTEDVSKFSSCYKVTGGGGAQDGVEVVAYSAANMATLVGTLNAARTANGVSTDLLWQLSGGSTPVPILVEPTKK